MKKLFLSLFVFLLSCGLSMAQTMKMSPRLTDGGESTESTSPWGQYNTPPTDAMSAWALPSTGGTSANGRIPRNTSARYQREEYLITAAEMAACGFPSSTTIDAIGFTIATAGVGTQTGTLVIYLRNTTDATYTLGSTWTTAGFTTVSTNSTWTVPIAVGTYSIPFVGGTSFTYTGGAVYVAWEFSNPAGTCPTTAALVSYCNTNQASMCYGYQGTTSSTALSLTAYRPATLFTNNTLVDILNVTNIYTTEKDPTPFGIPTLVGVRVSNTSAASATFNLNLAINSTPSYNSTQSSLTLAANTSATYSFTGWSPTGLGNVNAIATASAASGENYTANNTRTIPVTVNTNLFSYCNTNTLQNSYGFTYPGTGIWANKYHMTGTGVIPGANAWIWSGTPTSVGNTVYAVIMDNLGNIIAQSANVVLTTSNVNTNINFPFPTPPILTNADFYVGLAQTAGTVQWYPMGCMTEVPARSNAFYTFAITGGTPAEFLADVKLMLEAQVTAVTGPANPTNFAAAAASTSQINLSWLLNGSGNNVLVAYSTTGTFGTPSGSTYVYGDPISGGGTVLQFNNLTSYIHNSGLSPNTKYYYKAWSYNGVYSIGAITSATTLCDPSPLPINESVSVATFPVCWTQQQSTGVTTGIWSVSNTSAAGGSPYEMSLLYQNVIGTSRLVSPPINTNGVSSLLVSFKHLYDDYAAGVTMKVQSSTNGITWTDENFSIVGGNGNVGPANAALIVTNNLGATTYIAWTADGDLYSYDNWSIDDISIVVQPAVDLAFTSFYQTPASLAPIPAGAGNPYAVSVDLHNGNLLSTLGSTGNFVHSSNTSSTILLPNLPTNGGSRYPVTPVVVGALMTNNGYTASAYSLNWTVGGVSQPTYSGPSVAANLGTNLANLTYTPAARGTFITAGSVVAAGDAVPGNNNNTFRMRVYPDVFTRTGYDNGTNVVGTFVGWGAVTPAMKAGVRYTAATDTKLAGVDFIFRTETVTSGTITVQVRGAGLTTGAPGNVLYTKKFSAADYLPSGNLGDYITFPFDDDAPVIAAGSDYWITIKAPLGILYPGAAQSTGITIGHSFYEGSVDTTLWSALVLTAEYAWIMRSVNVSPITDKTLNLTSVFLESLYWDNHLVDLDWAPGKMTRAADENGFHWTNPVVADQITVELHNATTYATVEYSAPAVNLSTTGTATVTVPGDKNGFYYITIKHRNSLEATSALPQNFSGATISYAFDTQSKAYGLDAVGVPGIGIMVDGRAVIYAGDENQDFLVDGTDLQDIGNLADAATSGYLPQDINGDGLVDGGDLQAAGNNSDYAIGAVLP